MGITGYDIVTDHFRVHEAPAEPGAFFDWATERGWSDGLPLIPPTGERVDAMLAGYSGALRDLGVVAPRGGVLSVDLLAANAVMAGCKPRHLPVLIAAAQAMLDQRLNLAGLLCTTNPAGPLVIVNGPARDESNIGYGPNAMGSADYANSVIARALCLALKNVGGGGDVTHAVLGGPLKRGLVIGENEAESPWEPLSTRLGFEVGQSVVTVINVESVINVPAPYSTADGVLSMLTMTMQTGLNLHYSAGVPTVCLTPSHAQILAAAGFTAETLSEELFVRTRVPLSAFPAEGNSQAAEWITDGEFVQITSSPSKILVLVAGRNYPAHSTYFNGWATSDMASQLVPRTNAGG